MLEKKKVQKLMRSVSSFISWKRKDNNNTTLWGRIHFPQPGARTACMHVAGSLRRSPDRIADVLTDPIQLVLSHGAGATRNAVRSPGRGILPHIRMAPHLVGA